MDCLAGCGISCNVGFNIGFNVSGADFFIITPCLEFSLHKRFFLAYSNIEIKVTLMIFGIMRFLFKFCINLWEIFVIF